MTIDWHAACRETLKGTRDAIAWVNDGENEKTVGVERKHIDRRLRRLTTEAIKLDRAVDRPMCVGVFGPSQAGKSYLVSVLARKGEAPLLARFDGQPNDIDFVSEINPGGDKESTGLVTRFSIRPLPSPDGFPVCLRLLTEPDLVKIFANSFFLDGDPKKVSPASQDVVSKALADARASAGDQPASVNILTAEDIWDIQEYCDKSFDGHRGVDVLKAFWDEASVLAPRLSVAARAELFSVIWGQLPQFTKAYRELTEALAKLSFATDAFSPMQALMPRNESIIDVQTLSGLGKSDQPILEVKTANGPAVSLPRPVVTALTAELHIHISEQPWPFFTHTDLLDFPGARSRQPIDLTEYLDDEERDPVKETFLRGKIAYLFDRYVAEQELNSMLLCIPDSNQDVPSLPEMIDHWIDVSHGGTPQERLNKTVVLFFILTKFDRHFAAKAGEEGADPGERFASRLYASIEGFFGKAHGWPKEWTPHQPFQNCFWLRNPNFKSEFMIEYEGRKEVRLMESKQQYVADLKAGYMQVPAVNTYFSEPERAFDEALKLNDGGVTYLAERLAPVCREDLKYEQIESRLTRLREELISLLSPFYVDNNVEKRLEERREVSQQILGHVQQLVAKRQFADLVSSLQVSQQTFAGVLYDAYSRRGETKDTDGNKGAKPATPAVPAPNLPPIPGMPPLPGSAPANTAPAAAEGEAPKPAPAQEIKSLESYLARAAIEYWLGALQASVEAEQLSRFFDGDSKIAMELVSEIANAARRERLDQTLAKSMMRISGSLNEEIDLYLEKMVFASSAVINGFVNKFGLDELPEDKRPTAPDSDGTQRPIFAARKAANSAAEMSVTVTNFGYDLLADWMYALHATVEMNAQSIDGMDLNLKQNGLIGEILASLHHPLVEIKA